MISLMIQIGDSVINNIMVMYNERVFKRVLMFFIKIFI